MADTTPEFSSVVDHFMRHNVPMDLIDKRNQIVNLTLPGPIVCRVYVSADGGALMFKCVFSPDVPPARRAAMAEMVTRLNEGLHAGSFGLNWADGQITFRVTQWLAGPPSDDVMMRVVGGSVKSVERFRSAINNVAKGTSPESAARAVLGS